MQFPGYWVSGSADKVVITKCTFDETELSEESGWKQAHQNVDPGLPHGFVSWVDALADAEQRFLGVLSSEQHG